MSRPARAGAAMVDAGMGPTRRSAIVLTVGGIALATVGCATPPPPRTDADGSYCFRIGKPYRRVTTCTPAPIPSEEAEAEAKRFEPAPGRLTVYLVRKRWLDTKNVVRVYSGSEAADTVPQSFVRWRLPAGSHRFTATWPDGWVSVEVAGAAGEVVFVELIGTAWAWGSSYGLERGDTTESRQRAASVRLVADVGREAK